jgi:Domain of unknown function (DUF4915)
VNLLVSLCNLSSDRLKERQVFLLSVNPRDGSLSPVELPPKLSEGKNGVTGIARHGRGYCCLLAPASLIYLSEKLEVERVYELTLVRDGHSVACRDGKCYIVSTGTDSIVEFAPEHGERVFWSATESGTDTVHLNSLVWHSGSWWVSAFGPKRGPLWRSADQGYLLSLLTGERLLQRLHHPHSSTAVNGAVWVCESARMTLRSSQGHAIPIRRGYIRGLAADGHYFYVGSTKGRNRSKSTGCLIDNPADHGEPSGETGILMFTVNGGGGEGHLESFIDLNAYTDEIYDIVVMPE